MNVELAFWREKGSSMVQKRPTDDPSRVGRVFIFCPRYGAMVGSGDDLIWLDGKTVEFSCNVCGKRHTVVVGETLEDADNFVKMQNIEEWTGHGDGT